MDPIGLALTDFVKTGESINLLVESDLCDDDVMPAAYFFRTEEMMPQLEVKALELARGKVLDVGAGAGCHALILQQRGFQVLAIDQSAGAVEIMLAAGLSARQTTIQNLTNEKFDTILLLMNGIGIAGTIERLPSFLMHLKSLLNPGGQIIFDSTDLSYLYAEEDGSVWINLNDNYYGEMQFNMKYKDAETGWFPWLYIDFDNLQNIAEKLDFNCMFQGDGPNSSYLASLTLKSA